MDYKKCFNIFLGGKTGTFKGVNVNNLKTIIKNIHNISLISKEHEISALAWGDPDEKDILIGFTNQTVKIYDSDFKAFVSCVSVECGKGQLCGLSRYNESLVTAVESGHVKVWKYDSTDNDILLTGNPVSKMVHSNFNRDMIATGGKGNDLKLWNLKTKESVFKAKNVPKDSLELEVPVWVSDIAFLSHTDKVAVCSRYGHVRLYDPKAQRRPVINITMKDEVLMSLTVACREEHIVVGSAKGNIVLVDLRKPGKTVNSYKGCVGSVRSLACHSTKPYLVSVGLDRFLRVYDVNTRKVLCQEYVKTQNNCVLMRDTFDLNGGVEVETKPEPKCEVDSDIEIVEDDYDEIFDKMEQVEGK